MWKTVALRMTQSKAELEKMGEDTEYMVESTAKLQEMIKAMTGYDILEDDQKTLKSTYDIVLNIGKAWDSLNDLDRNALLYALGGTRQANALAAALTNIEDMEAAYEAAENSAGSARQEQEKYTKSIQYSLDVFKATGEDLASTIYDSEGLKRTVDGFTTLLELITALTKSIGGLGVAFTTMMAYKGLQGNGIFDFFKTDKSMIGGFKNLFTRQLSQISLENGLTEADISRLQVYNTALERGITDTTALEAATEGMSDNAQIMAGRLQAGKVQMNELTTASKAAAAGMKLLSMAGNILLSLGLSYGISLLTKKLDELIVTEEELKQQQEEQLQAARSAIEQNKQELKELRSVIKEYKSFADITNLSAEQKERLKEIQDGLIESYGAEANGIDLVNGKYDEQIAKLNKLQRQKAEEANADLQVLRNEAKQNYENNVGFEYSGKTYFEGWKQYGALAEESKPYLQKQLEGILDISSTDRGTMLEPTRTLTYSLRYTDENGNPLNSQQMLDQVKQLHDKLNEIRLDGSSEAMKTIDSKDFQYLESKTAELLSHYQAEVDEYNKTQEELAQNTLYTHKILVNGAEYYADTVPAEFFQEYKRKLIEEFSQGSDAELLQPMLDYLSKTYSDLAHMSDFDRYWTSKVTEETKKAAKEVQTEGIFDWADYAEELDSITESVNTLSSAYEKLKNGTMTAEDMIKLFKEYPDLSQYAYDTDLLAEKLQEVANQKVDPLIQSLEEMAKTIKDPVQRAQLEGLVGLLYQIANLSTGIDKTAEALDGLTVDDYIKYEEDSIQRVIDSLEAEKDYQEQILKNLKQQKEELEELIKEYESIPDIIGKYIDSYQIKPLEDRKSEIEEYYNTEIEKLKEENDERDKNIELQEKQAALANARKSKVRVYSETGGWTYEKDINAIQKAEKELADFQNELTIEGLEKARDQETKNIEKQIKEWQDYKDEWKKQVESIKESDEALTASKILGSDWREKINKKDVGSMSNFSSAYVAYNNKLNNQVNAEIAAQERAIEARENEINKWKGYKDEVSKLKDEIDEDNQKHLKNLEKFNTEENNSWNDRIGNMRRNVETIRALSAAANNVSLPVPGDVGVWAIMENGKVLDNAFYSSQEEAEKRRHAIAESRVRARMPGAPSGAIEAAINSLLSTLTIKKYARGGINTTTGLSWLDGTKNKSEVVFNSEQAKQLYEIVKSGNFSKMISDNIVSTFKGFLDKINPKTTSKPTTTSLSISFPNANINATDYDSFKSFMDRYTNDLLLKMQVGL